MYAGRMVEELPGRRPRPGHASLHAGPADCLPRLGGTRAAAADPRCRRPECGPVSARRASEVERLRRDLRPRSWPWPASPSGASRAPASASSANRAPASPPSCAPSRRPRSATGPGGILLGDAPLPAPARQRLLPPRADGVPGPLRLAASAPDGRPQPRRAADRSTASATSGAHRPRAGRGRTRPRSPLPLSRTSSPAASASASPSPAR